MKPPNVRAHRLTRTRYPVLLALGILCAFTHSAAAQEPNPAYDPTFAAASRLEATQPVKAFDTYNRIKNTSRDPRIQAEALLRAAELAASPQYGTTAAMHAEGDNKAHDALNYLEQHYADSPQAVAGKPLMKQIEARIDRRNSGTTSYKIVDFFVGLTGRVPDFSYWFALVLIALLVKTVTLPLTMKMYKSQREMQVIMPVIKEIQARYKGKPEMGQKVMDAYKAHGVHPLASCMPMVVQYPFLIWIYYAIRMYEYHFANGTFLWVGPTLHRQYPTFVAGNLSQFDFILLCLYAGSMYVSMKLTPTTDPSMAQQQKTMSVMMTVMMFWMFMLYRWSAAFMLYWLALNMLSIWQQYVYVYRPHVAGRNGGGGMSPPAITARELSEASGNGAGPRPRQATPIPGGSGMRPRKKRKPRR